MKPILRRFLAALSSGARFGDQTAERLVLCPPWKRLVRTLDRRQPIAGPGGGPATARQGDEVLEALGAHDQEEIRQIDAALARIDAGEYGACVTCGNDISAERLEVLPATPFCKNCAP